MSQDHSDSSDGDSSNYTTTNVLLGYASQEPTNDSFSQLGGTPVWPDAKAPPSSALARCKCCNSIMTLLLQLLADLPDKFPGHERRLYIFSCKRKACRRKDGSMRVIRGTKIAAKTQCEKDEASIKAQKKLDERRQKEQGGYLAQAPYEQAPRLGDNIFNSSFTSPSGTGTNPFAKFESQAPPRPLNDHFHRPLANPFAPSSGSNASQHHKIPNSVPLDSSKSSGVSPQTDLATTFAEKARITPPSLLNQPKPQQPVLPWPSPTELPSPCPSYHLDADIETLDPTPPTSLSKQATAAMTIDSTTPNDPIDKDAFESHLDSTFQRFADRVSQNPEQVLRYEYGAQPLLYSSTDVAGQIFTQHSVTQTDSPSGVKTIGRESFRKIPNCESCGAGRLFECQLMPAAITALEAEDEGLDGMEWGCVIVGVCGRDCTDEVGREESWGWREEWCGVQWEEIK